MILIDCTYFKSKLFIFLSLVYFIIMNTGCVAQESKINTKTKFSKCNEVHIDVEENLNFTDFHFLTNLLVTPDTALYNQLVKGQKHGKWRSYYENGQIKNIYTYKNGLKDGIGIEWWETGKLMTYGYYKNGVSNGIMKWYNEHGIQVASGNMTNNMRDGKWRICDFQLTSNCIEANFKNDKKIGLWKVLHDNGNVWKEQKWDNDSMIFEKCWDENGKKIKC